MGVRIARKHVGWYLKQQVAQQSTHNDVNDNKPLDDHERFRQFFNRIEVAQEQYHAIQSFFGQPPLQTTEILKGEIAA